MENFTAHSLTKRFQSGELTAEAITEQSLARIEKYDKELNSFLKVLSERSLEKARQLDQKRKSGKPLGRLAAVPVAIKDNIHIRKELTTCASKFLENYKAPFDATAVRLLEEEDAILIGKANMDEFAMGSTGEHSAFGATKNPWNLECSPGGSSSGSAAAVSARLCPIALGTDTGGSVRLPASYTGIFGFKPTYGKISRYGVVAFGSSLDQIGTLSTNTKDIAILLEIIGKHCKRDSTSLPSSSLSYIKEIEKPISKMRIGVPWAFLESLSDQSTKTFIESIDVFKSLGCEIIDVDLSVLKYSLAIYYIISTAEASTNLARFDGVRYGMRSNKAKTLEELYRISREEGFGSEVKNRIMLGTFVLSSIHRSSYFFKAEQARALTIQKVREAFTKCDIIALPTSSGTATKLGDDHMRDPMKEYLQDLYTIGVNLTGIPAISIPNGFNTAGKPYGLQLLGPQMKEESILRAARSFEKATDYSTKIPPGFGGEK